MKTQIIWKSKPLLVALCILFVVIIVSIMIHHHQHRPVNALPASIQQSRSGTNHPLSWHKVTVKKGDTLTHIFSRFHISYNEVKKILAEPHAKKYLGRLYAGQTFYLHIDHTKKQIFLKYPINRDETLYVYRSHQVYKTDIIKKPMTTALLYRSGVIHHSFSTATRQAGLTYKMRSQLSNIFAGSIHFGRNLQPGDHFSILYKEYYLNGKKVRAGNIIAASFTNRGKTYEAIRFTYPHNHTGYYTPQGRGVEPLFLKAPLKYKRISGHFTFHRYDPILHIVHPHLGIDYAAAYGTPIKSIGDGEVIYRGRKGGYGNAVVIRYNRKYRALYGHMYRIATHLRIHEHVHKGQVIGYVGSSGWSTGPHLHFEMYAYGIPRNPLKIKFTGGKTIPRSYLKQFRQRAKTLLAELKNHER